MEKKAFENYITESIKPVIVEEETLLKQTSENLSKYSKLAELISIETGVPKERIFAGYLLNYVNNWHKIGDEWFFYKKPRNGFFAINELLGEKISKHFGMETAEYQLAVLESRGKDNELGLVSKNICSPEEKYLSWWDCKIFNYKNLDFIKNGISGLCITPEARKLFADDVKTLFVRDYYSQQLDRVGYNVLLRSTDDGVRLGHLYDYSRSFESKEYHVIRNQFGEFNVYKKATKDIALNDDRFQELFSRLMEADMATFIEQVEDEHGLDIGRELKEHYLTKEKHMKKNLVASKIMR